ncbi:MAG: S8 family serine peptidase, partial [Candidatus Electryoneaceae bacterium]|nr:S8 family serine peptidase [Candidatus Electryoneaceae bacterium]
IIEVPMHRLSLIVLILLFSVQVCSLQAADEQQNNDTSWMIPGENVEAGQVFLLINPEFAPLDIEIYDGIATTDQPPLDAVADAFGVYDIRKAYKMEKSPDDPNKVDLSRWYVAYFPEDYGPLPLIEAYGECPEVELAEWMPIFKQLFIPDDPRYQNQWHLDHCGFPEAWEITHGSEDIIIGIVDSGLDMRDPDGFEWVEDIHEDMVNDLWINAGEDIDNDGVITFDDINEEDDDNNGYEDDFFGWDFTGRDNWPNDIWGAENGHGTQVGGIAAASTNNDLGASGAGFNCRLMYVGCYSIQDPDHIVNGYAGVEYCVDNGAQIINCSWGSYGGYNNGAHAAFRYAGQEGVAVFAGAGNGDEFGNPVYDRAEDNRHFYPCAFPEVIGVSATNTHDGFAQWATYGDFTDLVAPGEGILGSFPHNDYRAGPGTSFSSPLAAGTGALLLSVMPDLNPDQLLQRMQDYSTDVSELNEDWPGIQYRINAGFLIGATRPKLEVVEWSLRELEGNGDRWPEVTERFAVDITISNQEMYQDANNAVFRLETDDPTIRIHQSQGEIGSIGNGEQIEIEGDISPTFTVLQTWPHYTSLRLVIETNEELEIPLELPLTMDHPSFLLVDDDGGEHFQSFYESDLSHRPHVHDLWTSETDGLIDQEDLNSYPMVVWITGNAEDPLSESEQGLLQDYLDSGGTLFIAGQYIGDACGDTEFHQQYLHASHLNDNSEGRRLFGVAENPISDGVSLLLVGGDAGGNGRLSPSSMEPINGAVTLMTYDNEDEDAGGILYEGDDYRVIYLGFALEAASGLGGTTPRNEFVQRALDYYFIDAVDDAPSHIVPTQFSLEAPYPNPFNAQTTIRVSIPSREHYQLDVVDPNGRTVATLFDGFGSAGTHNFVWNASDVTTGVYFVKLTWAEGSQARKMVLLK